MATKKLEKEKPVLDDKPIQVEQELPSKSRALHEKSSHPHARRRHFSFRNIVIIFLLALICLDLYFHMKSMEDIEKLQGQVGSPQQATDDKKIAMLEAQVRSQMGDVLTKLATMAEKVESSASSSGEGKMVDLSDLQTKQILEKMKPMLEDALKNKSISNDDKGTQPLRGLLLVQILKGLVEQGQPYATALEELKRFLDKQKWMAPEIVVPLDILKIHATEGLKPINVLSHIPQKEKNLPLPGFLMWLQDFVSIESTNGKGFTRARQQTLQGFIDRGQVEEALALVVRHLDEAPQEKETWKDWISLAQDHIKTKKALQQLQQLLMLKEFDHVTNQ